MAGIFLSHSSQDKAFVTRLAVDLVNRGFPVWLDSWEIEVGDSLLDEIYDGLDESTYLMVLLSPNSAGSQWVKKELNGALMKEEELGRKFIIPVVIAKCKVPLKIRDRIHADFSKSYLKELEKLTAVLRKWNADKIEVPSNKQIIPLVFTRGIHLDTVALSERLNHPKIAKSEGLKLEKGQLLVALDEDYLALRDRLIERMENIENDPYYSPEFHQGFSSQYNQIFRLEDYLVEGMQMIIEAGAVTKARRFSPAKACYWFGKIMRANILYLMWNCQNPDRPDPIKISPECVYAYVGGESNWAKFFGVEGVVACKVGRHEKSPPGHLTADAVTVHVSVNSQAAKHLEENKPAPALGLRYVGDEELYSKYLIPQMLVNHLFHRDELLTWDFEGCSIGFA